jgi:hypothetical protein
MRHGRAGGSRLIPRRLGTALAPALCALLVTTGSASAATTVLQGRFACNDGGSLAGVRVELLQIYTRRLPEIPPNVRVAVATHADGNGGWGFRVSGGESNWRVRAVLVNADVGVKDFPIPWHHYADTLRTQNDRPLADYGTQVVPGSECRLWRAFKAAADGFRADTGGGHPAGGVTVFENAPTSGVPFSPYTDVWWPAGYSPTKSIETGTRSVAQHEFAHTVRHALDGDQRHFFFDTGKFWYLRSHSGSACKQTNHGFAFNEGWAEFWADEVRPTPCPNATDFSIERNVAFELKRLVGSCRGVNRGRMVAVLAQNRERIHSMSDFSNALGCVPRPVKRLGKVRRPRADLLALAGLRAKAGRAFVRSASAAVGRARSSLRNAEGAWPTTLARGRLDEALTLRKTFSYLASRSAQRRIARRSDRAQVELILGRQRTYVRRLRAISTRTLGKGASIFRQQGDAAGAELLGDARSMAGRGELGVLQAVGIPLPAPRQSGPSPDGIGVIDVGGPPPPPEGPPPLPPPPLPPPPIPDVDLVISRVYGDDSTAEAQCDIFADVRNAGSADAPASVTRFLSEQPAQFDELVATPALAAGATTTVRLNRQYGQYNSASVTVDATGAVPETDEANNGGSGAGTPSTSSGAPGDSGRCRYP